MDIGHWVYPVDFEPSEWFGFIYRIVDTTNNKEYIGKKQFSSHRSKKVVNRKNRKHYVVDSNWKKYTSSSDAINELIREFGKDRFIFIIESLHKTKASLTYAEVNQLIIEDALRQRLPDGTRKYYNKLIPAVKFLPPDDLTEEIESRLWFNNINVTHNRAFNWQDLTDLEKQDFIQKYQSR